MDYYRRPSVDEGTVRELLPEEELAQVELSQVDLQEIEREVKSYHEDPELEENCLTGVPALSAFCKPKVFVAFMCLYVLMQSMIVTGLFSPTISTIERRYDVQSTTMGFVASTYDVVVLVVAPLVSYFGGKGHTPRWLATGLCTLGIGGLLYASPQFMSGNYDYSERKDDHFCNPELDEFQFECHNSGTNLLFMFFVAQAVIALGASPLYTLGPAYFDQIISKIQLPIALAYFYMTAALGPALGFLLTGVFLDSWVDPGEKPEGAEPSDPGWVGAWWLGFVICGVLAVCFSIPLFLYPAYVPGTKKIREQLRADNALTKRRVSQVGLHTHQEVDSRFWPTINALVTNKTYMFNCLGQATESFAVSGFSAFLPKIVQSVFGLTASNASFAVGLCLIPGAAGGIFAGGWFIKKIKATAVQTAKICWVVAGISLVIMLSFYIGCDTINLAGVTDPYTNNALPNPGGVDGRVNLKATCNDDCDYCDPHRYDPVCGDDGINYFSGCHAGCQDTRGDFVDAVYFNCTCIPGSDAGTFRGAVSGKCDTDCNALPFFLLGLFFTMVSTFFNNIPATTVILRCIDPEHRSLGMGVQNMLFRLIGTIPAPVVFGLIIDTTCILDETDCDGTTGSCHEYDNLDLRGWLVFLAVVPKLFSVLFFFLSWYYFKGPRKPVLHRMSIQEQSGSSPAAGLQMAQSSSRAEDMTHESAGSSNAAVSDNNSNNNSNDDDDDDDDNNGDGAEDANSADAESQ